MADESIHELTAAYALDALDEREQATYEEHLAGCERCRADLATMSEAAVALAYAVETPPPPPSLRGRILDAAAGERSNVAPLLQGRAVQALGAAAAVAAGVAIGFGVWAASLHSRLGEERSAAAEMRAALGVLGDTSARRVVLGERGSVVVTPSGEAALVTRDLAAAPAGKTYEAWVIKAGRPEPAGLLRGGHDVDVLRLERPVSSGSSVAVTLEPKRGSQAPTSAPIFSGRA
jgi:anti-sigma factor RsiW